MAHPLKAFTLDYYGVDLSKLGTRFEIKNRAGQIELAQTWDVGCESIVAQTVKSGEVHLLTIDNIVDIVVGV